MYFASPIFFSINPQSRINSSSNNIEFILSIILRCAWFCTRRYFCQNRKSINVLYFLNHHVINIIFMFSKEILTLGLQNISKTLSIKNLILETFIIIVIEYTRLKITLIFPCILYSLKYQIVCY